MRHHAIAAGLALALLASTGPALAGDETCQHVQPTWYVPTGVVGCTLDGPTPGVASWWHGDVAAANWCTWPWDDCGQVAVQSHQTGLVITVRVGMFCGCLTGSPQRRLIDLTAGQVAALGLDPADGTYDVTVTPLAAPRVLPGVPTLPDTAVSR